MGVIFEARCVSFVAIVGPFADLLSLLKGQMHSRTPAFRDVTGYLGRGGRICECVGTVNWLLKH